MEYAIPVVCFAVGGVVGFFLGRARAWAVLGVIAAVLAAVVVWQWFAAQQAPSGWDGIAIMVLVFLFLMPGLVGLLTGGWFAWWKSRRAKRVGRTNDVE